MSKPEPEVKPKRRLFALSTALSAMAQVEELMHGLSEDDRGDVAAWFARRYLSVPPAPKESGHVPHHHPA